MSLDVSLVVTDELTLVETEVFEGNLTHNLKAMAEAAGLYEAVWHPYNIEDDDVSVADDLIPYLEVGLEDLKARPDYFKSQFSPPNGWGTYDGFVSFLEYYLDYCKEYPEAEIRTWC